MEKTLEQIAEEYGLDPLPPLELAPGMNTSDVMKAISNTAFIGRTLGEAADLMETILKDENCIVVLTLSGAMTMAGLSKLIRMHVDRGWVHCIVSTGALVGHGMIENLGLVHYKADPQISDEEYYRLHLNRVYDTLEPEENLDELERSVRVLFRNYAAERRGEPVGTRELLAYMGRHLPGTGILQAAVEASVPIIIPAFTDCELGLDFAVHRTYTQEVGLPSLVYDGFRDLEFFREFCERHYHHGHKLAIMTIGGGVPRNWAQQVGPYIDVRNNRLGLRKPRVAYQYGLRICPDPVYYGHLSGCTYSEGVSWGKFLDPRHGGRFSEVLLDATVAWPLLSQAMLDRGL